MSYQPTILIGHGRYGQQLLDRFLEMAAVRRALPWMPDPTHRAGRVPRYMRIFQMSDRQEDEALPDADFELTRDLRRMVQPLSDDPGQVKKTLSEASDELLGPRSAAERETGLDIILAAAPQTHSSLGYLIRVLQPAIDQIGQMRAMEALNPQAGLVNFIALLDFDDLWSQDRARSDLRRALIPLTTGQRVGQALGGSRFGRIYLFDGVRQGGTRNRKERMEEAHVFLDLLLLEHQRHGPLQDAFQPVHLSEEPFAAVSLGTIELDGRLIAQLAKASFGSEWLKQALKTRETDMNPFGPVLRPLSPEALRDKLSQQKLRSLIEECLEQASARLPEMRDIQRADWPKQLQQSLSDTYANVRNIVSALIKGNLDASVAPLLEKLEVDLNELATKALNDSAKPLTWGEVRSEVRRWRELMKPAQPAEDIESLPRLAEGAEKFQSSYLAFREGLVKPELLKEAWLMVASVLALLIAPVAAEALGDWPEPATQAPLILHQLHDFCSWLADRSWLLLLVFWPLTWLTARKLFHRSVERRVEHVLEFYNHPERGRITGFIRRSLRSLIPSLSIQAENLAGHSRRRILWQVDSVLQQLEARLDRTAAEMQWLIDQLENLLRRHDANSDSGTLRFLSDRRKRPGPRVLLETSEMLKQAYTAPSLRDVASLQARSALLTSPTDDSHSLLLDPIGFLEKQADDTAVEPSLDKVSEEDLENAIERAGTVSLSCYWKAHPEVPTPRKYAVLPAAWRSNSALMSGLQQDGFDFLQECPASEPGRAYLVTLQTGVPAALLEPAAEHA